jgi:hypothetical protein
VLVTADDDYNGVVSHGQGETLVEAVQACVSRFAEMQRQTLDALHVLGIRFNIEPLRHPDEAVS